MKNRIKKKFQENREAVFDYATGAAIVAGGFLIGYGFSQYMNSPVDTILQTHKDTGQKRAVVVRRNGKTDFFYENLKK